MGCLQTLFLPLCLEQQLWCSDGGREKACVGPS